MHLLRLKQTNKQTKKPQTNQKPKKQSFCNSNVPGFKLQ